MIQPKPAGAAFHPDPPPFLSGPGQEASPQGNFFLVTELRDDGERSVDSAQQPRLGIRGDWSPQEEVPAQEVPEVMLMGA